MKKLFSQVAVVAIVLAILFTLIPMTTASASSIGLLSGKGLQPASSFTNNLGSKT